MTDNFFEIKLLDTHWIRGVDDPNDLCAHGHVYVKIGEEVVSDKNNSDVTISAAALHLMRTIKKDYKKNDFASQLIPHCGHFIISEKHNEFAIILGCPIGIDWTIIHTDDNKVKHISENGQEILVDQELYKKIVFHFADQVECFYKASLPKIIPTDDFDKEGYLTFWKEWRKLRNGS
jgi:hypothetical protein